MTASNASNSSNTSIQTLNWVNLIAYILNTAVTYGIGVTGFANLPTNAELSLKYQTLVTPAGWAFAIWGLIFIAQLIWVVYPLVAKTQRNSPYVLAVGYNYLWVCLAQAGWTLSFSNEIITLSLIMMLTIWFFLFLAVRALFQVPPQQEEDSLSIKQYLLWLLPFTLHFGWITAASAVNVNVELVSVGASANVQFYAAAISLLVLVLATLFFLHFDYTVPLVISWALWGVYNELSNPKDLISESFSEDQIKLIRLCDVVALVLILICVLVKFIRAIVKKANRSEGGTEEQTYLRAPDQ